MNQDFWIFLVIKYVAVQNKTTIDTVVPKMMTKLKIKMTSDKDNDNERWIKDPILIIIWYEYEYFG